MADEEVVLRIDLDTSEVDKAFKDIEKKSKDTAKKVEKDQQDTLDGKTVKNVTLEFNNLNESLDRLANKVGESTAEYDIFNRILNSSVLVSLGVSAAFDNLGNQLAAVFSGIANVILGTSKGLLGFATNFTAIQAGIEVLADAFKASESQIVRSIGKILEFSGIITGILSGALVVAIRQVGRLSKNVGTFLVERFDAAAKSFVQTDKALRTFVATVVVYNKNVRDVRKLTFEWNTAVNDLSESLNLSRGSLQKASTEIISVGKRLGLTTKQQQKLLEVTAAYAKVTGKDVFDASVAFVSALNGQSQSVLSYGVKLNEAALQQRSLRQGINNTFRDLSSKQKIQQRFNFLVEQSADAALVATVVANGLDDANKKLLINQERLAASFGRGAAVIEQNNILTSVYSSILSNIPNDLLALAGGIGAFGARVLQVGGFLLEFSFIILAVTKGVQLLNLALSKNLVQSAFATSIPLVGKSLNQLIVLLTGTSVKLTSTTSLIGVLGKTITKVFKTLPGLILKTSRAFISLLLPLAPIILKIGLIVAAIGFLIKVFKEIEKRTGVFTELFSIFTDELTDGTSVLSIIKGAFNDLINIIKGAFAKALGVAVFALAKLIQGLVKIANADPFGTLSERSKDRLEQLGFRLKGFTTRLQAANFELDKLGEKSRNIASIEDGADLEKLTEKLNELRDALKDVGKTDIGLLTEDLALRTEVLRQAFENDLINLEEFNLLQEQLLLDFSMKEDAIFANRVKKAKKRSFDIGAALANGVSRGIQNMVRAIAAGENAFEALGKNILGLLGDLAIQVGTFMIATGFAQVAALSAPGGPVIAAGIGLVALGTVLKLIGDSGFGGASAPDASATGGGVSSGGGAFVGEDPDDIEDNVTKVSIDVSGQVLNPLEVGNQLAEVLNDAFEAGGTRVVTA